MGSIPAPHARMILFISCIGYKHIYMWLIKVKLVQNALLYIPQVSGWMWRARLKLIFINSRLMGSDWLLQINSNPDHHGLSSVFGVWCLIQCCTQQLSSCMMAVCKYSSVDKIVVDIMSINPCNQDAVTCITQVNQAPTVACYDKHGLLETRTYYLDLLKSVW